MSAIRKILVVDDDPVVGKSIDRVLSGKGYAVINAANAEEAMGKLRSGEYDAVFTDIRMPGLDGVELAEQVKAKQPWTPVVIITGYGTVANEERAREAGVTAFLRKPLSPEMIEETAAKAIHAAETVAEAAPAAPAAPAVEAPKAAPAVEQGTLKTIALLLAAPFIGLAYIVLLPFVGLGYLAVAAVKGLARLPMVKTPLTFLKDVGLFVAAPFIGLLYVIAFPFVGATVLVWTAAKGLMTKPADKG
ncbi:MAG TPA: response regulator [Methyloceanibacter sp.]|nr:response regulator [Methyloceanibacter sp.]